MRVCGGGGGGGGAGKEEKNEIFWSANLYGGDISDCDGRSTVAGALEEEDNFGVV